jgi:hypothetical protein
MVFEEYVFLPVGSINGAKTDVQHFDWTNNTLLFEDIPNGLDPKRTAFFLGGKDMVINAKVSSYTCWNTSRHLMSPANAYLYGTPYEHGGEVCLQMQMV